MCSLVLMSGAQQHEKKKKEKKKKKRKFFIEQKSLPAAENDSLNQWRNIMLQSVQKFLARPVIPYIDAANILF